MAKLVQIESFDFKILNCVTKNSNWDPFHLDSNPNHLSICVLIEGESFFCEPMYGAGSFDEHDKFYFEFNDQYFLRPLVCGLNDHFPLNPPENLIHFNYTFEQFTNTPDNSGTSLHLRAESHPFLKFDCSGSLKMQFSCLKPLESITCKVFPCEQAGDKRGIPNNELFTGYEIVQQSIPADENRCRFNIHIVFPQIGLFKIHIFINLIQSWECFVNNLQPYTSIPFLHYYFLEESFIPILPKSTLTPIHDGIAVIRFLVSMKHSVIMVKSHLIKVETFEEEFEVSDAVVSLIQPFCVFDQNLIEELITVTFQRNGRYKISIFLPDDQSEYSLFTAFYFDVQGAYQRKPIFPSNLIYQGRQFPLLFFENIQILPPDSLNFIQSSNLLVNFLIQKGIKLDIILQPLGEEQHIPSQVTEIEQNTSTLIKYSFSLPQFGIYTLFGFINLNRSFVQFYDFREKSPPEPPSHEIQIQEQLSSIVNGRVDELLDVKNFYENQSKPIKLKRHNSKEKKPEIQQYKTPKRKYLHH